MDVAMVTLPICKFYTRELSVEWLKLETSIFVDR